METQAHRVPWINDNVGWAILQHQNTPIQSIGLSLAQLLLPCRLCDAIPSQPILFKPHFEWVATAQCHGEILHHCNAEIEERYNKYTHNLPPLKTDGTVAIQSPQNHRWNTMGKIITVLPDHQYRIRVDGLGRITLRNCQFLRKCKIKPAPTPIPSATPVPMTSSSNAPLLHPDPPTSGNGTCTAIEPPNKPRLWLSRIPQTLFRLLSHNRPGLKQGYSPQIIWPTHLWGKGDVEVTASM